MTRNEIKTCKKASIAPDSKRTAMRDLIEIVWIWTGDVTEYWQRGEIKVIGRMKTAGPPNSPPARSLDCPRPAPPLSFSSIKRCWANLYSTGFHGAEVAARSHLDCSFCPAQATSWIMKLTIQSSAAVVSGGACFTKEEVKRLGAAAMCDRWVCFGGMNQGNNVREGGLSGASTEANDTHWCLRVMSYTTRLIWMNLKCGKGYDIRASGLIGR